MFNKTDDELKELNNRKETIFIEYDGILKSGNLIVIYRLSQYLENNPHMINKLDATIPIGLSLVQCLYYTLGTIYRNPIESFTNLRGAKAMQLYNILYKRKYNEEPSIFLDSPHLIMYDSLIYMASQSFIESVTVYSRVTDERIEEDMKNIIGVHRNIRYINGDLKDAFKMVKEPITTYMLHDSDSFDIVKEDAGDRIVDLGYPRYQYNIDVFEDNPIDVPDNINLSLFVPITLAPYVDQM